MQTRFDRGENPIVLLVTDRLLATSIDCTAPLFELSAVAGLDLAKRRDILYRALEKVNREHGIIFAAVRGVGYRRLASESGVGYAGRKALKRTRSAARKGRKRVTYALQHANDVSSEERRKANQTMCALGLAEHLAQLRTVKALPEYPPPKPDIQKRLKEALGV